MQIKLAITLPALLPVIIIGSLSNLNNSFTKPTWYPPKYPPPDNSKAVLPIECLVLLKKSYFL